MNYLPILALAWLCLASVGPVYELPRATVRQIAVHPARVTLQACDQATARVRLREDVFDERGYPIGFAVAWSCVSADAAQQALNEQIGIVQATAAQMRAVAP